ncbi:MAG: hypothetical protein ACQCXQ_02925 [Verrucomicrobiales bacterium]|nr:hypothetical protein [Verrucomicrobiota bacterium JB025]
MKNKLIATTLCAFTAFALTNCGEKAADGGADTPVADDASAAVGGGGSSTGVAGGTQLETELPPELIEGTPKPMNVPGLQPEPKKIRDFYVPEGTELLSTGKTVTSSDDAPIIGELELITDGDKDAGEGYFVELLDESQWVQIDLEAAAEIHAVWVWHFHSQKRAYHDVIVQISDDPEFETGVTTVYNNDYDDSSGMGKGADSPYVETRYGLLVDGLGTKGRYVRLYSNGNTSNDMNHYIEVEVYGKKG